MRKVYLTLGYLASFSMVDFSNQSATLQASNATIYEKPKFEKVDTIVPTKPTVTINPLLTIDTSDKLMKAMIQVESLGKADAVGDNGNAIGILQMHPIAVRSVNQICEKNDLDLEFSYDDRYDPEKTMQMYWIWRNAKHSDSTDEVIARSWNGGPNGPNINATTHYWNKVQIALKTTTRK
tara:strand:- start:1543 stop:2082 length:540 start_codon:yes stop_codon:yes gene_type:complete